MGKTNGEWISVDDKTPEHGHIVILCGRDVERILGTSAMGYWNESYSCFSAILEDDEFELCTATHWMPLPEPPQQ